MILLAGILTAGFMSANNNINVNGKEIKEGYQSVTNLKENSSEEKIELMRQVCVVFHATCTSAYSCWAEDTPMERVYEWADNIQNNYCMIDSPFQP